MFSSQIHQGPADYVMEGKEIEYLVLTALLEQQHFNMVLNIISNKK